MATTIVKVPVTFVGDNEFDHEDGMILMSMKLWLELVVMGHWIEDSIVLRWAELTSQRIGADLSDLLVILLTRKQDARMDEAARQIYVSARDIAVAWTRTRLENKTMGRLGPTRGAVG